MPNGRSHLREIVTRVIERVHRAVPDPAEHTVLVNVSPPVLLERIVDQIANPDGDRGTNRPADQHAAERGSCHADAQHAQRSGAAQRPEVAGAYFAQQTRCPAVGNRVISRPISARIA
jgi:hypothetical protein